MDAELPDIKQVEHGLESATVTPIAELGPHLADPTKRSVQGVITIVWPYSIVTKSLSFILAEPDFRLRRQKGQVRVIFVGQCAKTIADASLGGGDEVLLSLEGVEWVEGDAPGIAGATLEWHAKFTSGVLLRVRNIHGEQFKDPRVIYVDSTASRPSTAEPALPTFTLPPVDETPDTPATPEPILPTKRQRQEALDPDEYASPAFIKRARVSYGSLFEGAFDFLDDDLESSGQNRRRSRFGRDSSAWRYTSRSRSPEPEGIETETTPSKRVLAEVPSGEPRPEPEAVRTETTLGERTLEEVSTDKPHPEPDAMQVEKQPSEHTLEVPSNEPSSHKHPTLVDEGSQTSELLPPPPTPSPLQRDEGTVVHESGATLIAVSHINGDVSSPIHPHHATVDHHPGFDRIPFQTVTSGIQSADIPQPALFHTQHTTFTSFQEQRLHSSSEPGIQIPFGGFSNNPIPWGSSVPYQAMYSSHESASTSFASHHEVSPYPDLSPSFAAPSQQHALGPPLPAVTGQDTSEPHIEPQHLETHVASDVESAQGDMTDGEPVAETEARDKPLYVEGNIRTLLPDRFAADLMAGSFTDVRERPASEIMSPGAEELDLEEGEAFSSDDGDEAGDYDTQNHADTQDDDEGSFDEEYSENYDESDEATYEAHGGSGQKGEYEGEGEDEGEEHGENEEWAGLSQSTVPPASSAPVFIDLISDSEDEDVQGNDAEKEGRETVEAKEATGFHQQVNAAEEVEQEVSDEHHEEEDYNDEDDEDEVRSLEDLERDEGEDEGKSPIQVRELTPSSGHHDEADSEAHHDLVPADPDRDEDEGTENFDMVASAPRVVAPLSSPPPEAPASPVIAQVVEPTGSVEPVVTKPVLGEDLKQENTKLETSKCDPAIMADSVQPVADQTAEDGPAPTPVSPMDAEKTSPKLSSQEADVDVDEDIRLSAASPERYASQPVSSPVQRTEGSAPPESISLVETDERGLAGSTPEADMEEDTRMGDASPDQHTSQPATPLARHAQDSVLPESTSSIKAEEGGLQEHFTREAHANEDAQIGIASLAQHIPPPATSLPGQHARGNPLSESTSPVKAKEIQPQEQPPTEADAEEDTEMGIASPIQHISQPATSPIQHAQEPVQADMADNDEMDVDIPIPVREALDEQVQADIERQVLEDSSFIGLDDAETGQLDGAPSRLQSVARDAMEEQTLLDLPGRAQEPASPPLTQATQSLELGVTKTEVREEIAVVNERPEPDHLLTPDATQLTSASQSFEAAVTMGLSGGSSEGASKATLGSPTVEPSRHGNITTPVGGRLDEQSPPPYPSQSVEEGTGAGDRGYGAEGFAITVNSLRSKRHRRKLSLEMSEDSRRDPSTRIARASIAAREKSESAKRDSSARRATRSSPAARHAAAALDATLSPRLPGRTTRSRARSSQMSATPEPPQPKSPELGDVAAGPGASGRGGDTEKETESQGLLKLQLNKNLRLSLLDLTALKVLRNNVNKKVDVLGVATAQPASPQRPKHGPRDYLLSLAVTDQTTCPNGVVAVQVFRPHIESLPVVKEGDVVLLRQFAVTALRGRGFGLRSCETSSWAVWEAGRDDGLPQIKGPPVEVAPEEAVQAGLLLRWYAGLGGRAREKLGRANARTEQG